MYDAGEWWLNATNAALGIGTLLFGVVIAVVALYELVGRRPAR